MTTSSEDSSLTVPDAFTGPIEPRLSGCNRRWRTWFYTGLLVALAVMLVAFPLRADQPRNRTALPSPDQRPVSADTPASASRPTDTDAVDTATSITWPPKPHRIRSGDVLTVKIMNENWGGKYTVPPSGYLDFPFAGTLYVVGMTREDLKRALRRKLVPEYFHDPHLQINYEAFGKIRVLVLGAVGKPSHVQVEPGDGVMDALLQAGSMTDYSVRTKLYLFRRENGDTAVHFANYSQYVKGDLSQNIAVHNNDVLYVRTQFWPHFDTLQSVLRPLGFAAITAVRLQEIAGGSTD